MRAVAGALLALLLAASPAAAQELRRGSVDNETMKGAPVVAPVGEPTAIVALISDLDGWTPARAAQADKLAGAGALVIGIDLPRYLAGVSRNTEECIFLSGDVEEYGRLAGKQMGLKSYRLPVLLGAGKGADVAYAMLSQAPANMFSGAVTLGFTGRVPLAKPLCDGPKTETRDGADLVLGHDTAEPLQGEWRVLTEGPAPQSIKDFVQDLPDADVVELQKDASLDEAVGDAVFDIGGGTPDAVNHLPLVLYPPKSQPPKGVAVIYAGDGGWRDLDKTIAGYFNDEGYGVVGIDTLRYFWNEKSPRELGDDLEAIVTRYSADWKTKKILLAGYSFGADVIPFAWQRVSRAVRDQVKLIALLGLSKTADFEVSVSGWLGVGSGEHDVLKPAATLPMDRVMCVYGKDELDEKDNDVACATDAIAPAARVELPGGHHFDEDYEALARRIDGEFVKRAGGPK
ncbi:AcvB/VirJ family lysyl-phosphatidylglycerol hydrolase [Hansschlegelia zhihuaiae]|uniref:Virulence factor family protein n=1 Tax=Hansschlegelia zhihuaiae TaxID=405005 RepID=A0A4Q0MR72_9HYPH|nr:AcvB/VirJ family lysyl-phosphatidylglycerol hydrolase [Hansschlegelia zhihuaiae]RXF75646.1 virulence factor family protein [Hansschlegelia zhihuaiae]